MAGAYVGRELGRGPFVCRPWVELPNGFMVRGTQGCCALSGRRTGSSFFMAASSVQHSHGVEAPVKQGPPGPGEGNSR